jgi:hypothetical protein
VATNPRPDLTGVEPWDDSHLELNRAADAFDHAQDLALIGAERLVGQQEAVEQLRLAGGTDEVGLEDERVVEVRALVLPRPLGDRADRAMAAALPVEQAAERASRIEPRQAAPVDRSVSRDQRGAVAVADQRVVGDRRISVWFGHGQ